MKTVVVLFSGGIDSTTCLFSLMRQPVRICLLHFDYGQKQFLNERDSIRDVQYYIFHELSDAKGRICSDKIIAVEDDIFKTSMVRKEMRIPSFDKQESEDTTHVMMREVIFASMAVAYADSINAQEVYMSNHASYDPTVANLHLTNQEAIDALKKVVWIGSNKKIKLKTPFLDLSKKDVCKLANELAVPIDLCWTCYNGGRNPCGKCKACYERNKAFKQLTEEMTVIK